MPRIVITVIVSLILIAAAFYGYQNYLAPVATPTPASIAVSAAPAAEVVTATGQVVPLRSTNLSFKIPGRVVEVHVGEGDAVKQGDVLARLDDAILQKQIAQAQAQVEIAQQEVAQAQAQVHLSQKQFAQVQAGGTAEQIAAAQATLNAAQANYAKVKEGPTADELAQLKANIDNAKAALDQAQAVYDRIGGATNPFIAQTQQSRALQQATNNYNAALAAYDDARTHPTTAELSAAYAQIQQAQEALARLTPTQQAIDVAQAQVDAAQAALAVAQAQVDSVQAALETAKAQAQDYALVAPFDGTIAVKSVEVGQVTGPGSTAFVVGDLSKVQIETTDLAEVDAPKVSVGASVKITSDNFPGKTFQGTVARLAPLASDHRGDQVFKVTIDLTSEASELKWGMTTNVEIAVAQK